MVAEYGMGVGTEWYEYGWIDKSGMESNGHHWHKHIQHHWRAVPCEYEVSVAINANIDRRSLQVTDF